MMAVGRVRLSVSAAIIFAVVAPSAPVSVQAQLLSGSGGIGRYRQFGDGTGFRNVLPAGQGGNGNVLEAAVAALGTPPPHTTDQYGMYHELGYAATTLSESQVASYFKDASFGVAPDDIDRVYSPTWGVTVVRDKSFGVPHIFGTTRAATMFAQGYTGAEDRLFVMDVLRHVGRARLSEFLGPSADNQAMDRAQLAVAPYTAADLTRQVKSLAASGPEGAAVVADAESYARGVNAFITQAWLNPLKLPAEYPALQQLPRSWTVEDSVAIASYIGGRFGRGGGQEVANLCGLQAMDTELQDAAAARRIFDDLHFTEDPEAPTSTDRPAPYPAGLGPVDPASQPALDCSTLTPIGSGVPSLQDVLAAIRGAIPLGPESPGVTMSARAVATTPWGSIDLTLPDDLSNALLVSASKSKGGKPIAVMGPQVGYFAPQILVEKDVHGPGIDARGVGFPGVDFYVLMGRGPSYAWSATSSQADNTDQFVLRLCDPAGRPATTASMGEMINGRCEPLEAFQHLQLAKPTLIGLPASPTDIILNWPVQRSSSHGPLVARGKLLDGTPVAVATRRSTYGAELSSTLGFRRLNDPGAMAAGFSAFRRAVAGIDFTFNWFYVDGRDIGYAHSCRCPQRAPGVDPNLPAWGTGPWGWRGFIPRADNPWDLNPPSGYITSWNNKQAPGFTAADDQFSYGPVFRSQLLDRRIEAAIAIGPVDRAAAVRAMADAGTADLRGEAVLPLLLEVLASGSPPVGLDPRVTEMRDRLASWAAGSAHRRDLNRDGAYDDPVGPAIMDAWWSPLVHAIFDAPSGHAVSHLGIVVHYGPQDLGSAFFAGMYGHVHVDLRKVLGQAVTAPWSQTYCGGGSLAACRQTLWDSLSVAAGRLQAEFGTPVVGTWKRTIADDQIVYSALGLSSAPPAPWVNRPTFQQLVQVGAV